MDLIEFEKLVTAAINDLPPNIKNALNNVAIVVEPETHRRLLGLYEGVPQNQWGKDEAVHLPDKITIFKGSIEREAKTPKEVRELVKLVVWHEIAHYFGFEEGQMCALEQKWKSRIDF